MECQVYKIEVYNWTKASEQNLQRSVSLSCKAKTPGPGGNLSRTLAKTCGSLVQRKRWLCSRMIDKTVIIMVLKVANLVLDESLVFLVGLVHLCWDSHCVGALASQPTHKQSPWRQCQWEVQTQQSRQENDSQSRGKQQRDRWSTLSNQKEIYLFSHCQAWCLVRIDGLWIAPNW